MVRIVIVNGMPGCGKTTFENYCVRKLSPYADVYSTVDFVKEIAKIAVGMEVRPWRIVNS